jgi:anti-sigma factor ChrR (cupin superfamily)
MIIWPMSRIRGVMSCHQAARVIQSYLDGETDIGTGRAVATHLELCRQCGMKAATYEAIKAALAHQAPDTDREAVARLSDFVEGLAHTDPGGGPAAA